MPDHQSYPCPENREPLTIAENLCVVCCYEDTNARAKTLNSQVNKAWRVMELAIATQKPQLKLRSIEAADELLERALKQKSSSTQRHRGIILQGLMPALLDRAQRRKLQPQSKRHANEAFGSILSSRFHEDPPEVPGGVQEVLALYLLSREGADHFFYAASPREEQAVGKRRNHDIYQLWETVEGQPTKFPVQLKARDGQADKYDVPVLALRPTLRPVLELIGSHSLNDLIHMSAHEHLGGASVYQETVLDFATHCLQSAISNLIYKEILTGRTPKRHS